MEMRQIKRALISVYHKDGIDKIATKLNMLGVEILSTGGTCDFIRDLGIPVTPVEDITSYPSILGGRVKTLHPKVFGGILSRRDNPDDQSQLIEYDIPAIDLVIVDLYPFEKYVESQAPHNQIIEKIDIGGISLIRAAAKNYQDVLIVACKELYGNLEAILENGNSTTLKQRMEFAAHAFNVSSHYDTSIFRYFSKEAALDVNLFKESINESIPLRYGENPHQNARFYGNPRQLPQQLHGKEISYNNLLDIEAAIELISDFQQPTIAILKHNNACGCATRDNLALAWKDALAADPVSAFGGVIAANRNIDKEVAAQMNNLFFEVVVAPSYDNDALEIPQHDGRGIGSGQGQPVRNRFKLESRYQNSPLNQGGKRPVVCQHTGETLQIQRHSPGKGLHAHCFGHRTNIKGRCPKTGNSKSTKFRV
jgi:phosphoribosylaminoimidazolecarboxamide formyltransferase/IMP cyclohydrolase